jgi:hypothetical protein
LLGFDLIVFWSALVSADPDLRFSFWIHKLECLSKRGSETKTRNKQVYVFWGVSDPLCLSSSLALHVFRLFFLGPPPC